MRPIQQILSDIETLKAAENILYNDIDDVQGKIINLEREKQEAEFWIKTKSNRADYQSSMNTHRITPEQAKYINQNK